MQCKGEFTLHNKGAVTFGKDNKAHLSVLFSNVYCEIIKQREKLKAKVLQVTVDSIYQEL